MMTMTVSTNVPFGGVGKVDGDCDSDGGGDSDSGVNAFNNQQMLQAAMECRGGADRGGRGDDDNEGIDKHSVRRGWQG
jgi:hypothetical protein